MDEGNEIVKLGELAFFVLVLWGKRLKGRQATPEALETATGLSNYKVRAALGKLQAAGYVLPAGRAYQLTGNVLQLSIFAGNDTVPVVDLAFEPEADEQKKNFFSLEEEDDDIDKSESKSTSSSEEGEKKFFLECSDVLFGGAVVTHGIDFDLLTVENILGWLAEAYDTRKRLKSPAGLVYKRLQQQEPARNKYKLEPGKYLPPAYLEKIGRVDLIPKCEGCGLYPCECELDPPPVVVEYVEPEPDERVFVRWEHGGSMTPANAWNAALGQLQMEMPKAAFDTWVRDAVLLDADPETGVFTVGVWNSYAREWVESRLSSSLVRLLTGIMNQTVGVKFEVMKK